MMVKELSTLHTQISDKLKSNQQLIDLWKSPNAQLLNDCKKYQIIITLNIGGKEYSLPKSTLLSIEDTLFYVYFYFNKDPNDTKLFFDREGKFFGDIIAYYNHRSLPLKSFSDERLKILQADAFHYEIGPLINYIDYYLTPIKLEAIMTPSTVYYGDNDINDSLTSKQINMGVICDKMEYSIIFKLNIECEFNSIELKGYCSEIRQLWDRNYGYSSLVFTSIDAQNWINVGQLPSDIRTIQIVPLLRSKARYIKFYNYSPIGIGYLKLNKCNN